MLKKISSEETLEDRSTAELDTLKHTDWVSGHVGPSCGPETVILTVVVVVVVVVSQARLWVQLMKELRQGVKLKKVQEQQFDPLPTEFSLTPFEMLMQDIRARRFQLRKVMVRRGPTTQLGFSQSQSRSFTRSSSSSSSSVLSCRWMETFRPG